MASFQVTGIITNISYKEGFCIVFVSEYKRGYKQKNGVVVEDKHLLWSCLYKQGLVKYINDHFGKGMVVEVKGEIMPYAIEHGNIVDGYSVIGQTLNMASFPSQHKRDEVKMQKDSRAGMSDATPDVEGYMESDF